MVRDQPDYAAAICALGVVDAALGNKDAAIREGERAVELVPVNKSAIQGPMLIQYLAVIYAWGGEKDRAIERLTEDSEFAREPCQLRRFASQPALGPVAGRPAL